MPPVQVTKSRFTTLQAVLFTWRRFYDSRNPSHSSLSGSFSPSHSSKRSFNAQRPVNPCRSSSPGYSLQSISMYSLIVPGRTNCLNLSSESTPARLSRPSYGRKSSSGTLPFRMSFPLTAGLDCFTGAPKRFNKELSWLTAEAKPFSLSPLLSD